MNTDEGTVGNLLDVAVPSFRQFRQPEIAPWTEGWYKATTLPFYEFENREGNITRFETIDEIAQKTGRNIRVVAAVTRQSDNLTRNVRSKNINYRPTDFTTERMALIETARQRNEGRQKWDDKDAHRTLIAFGTLGELEDFAGVPQFTKNGNGGLELSPLSNKTGYVRLAFGDENDQGRKYLEITRFATELPKTVKAL